MATDNVFSYGGTTVFVGLSGPIGITIQAGVVATIFKNGSGTSTILWAGGAGCTIGSYLMGATEALPFNNSGTMFFFATGATATVYVLNGSSPGF